MYMRRIHLFQAGMLLNYHSLFVGCMGMGMHCQHQAVRYHYPHKKQEQKEGDMSQEKFQAVLQRRQMYKNFNKPASLLQTSENTGASKAFVYARYMPKF